MTSPFAVVAILLTSIAVAADDQVLREAAPNWVQPLKFEAQKTQDGEGGSARYLAVDLQHHLEEKVKYQGFHIRILNEAGVKDHSQLSFEFQPEYQTLALHTLQLEREGQIIDRLANAEIEIIRREEGMAHQLYDGELTAHIILEDVRPGDVLSYSFSTRGANPVFEGHVHSWSRLGFSVEIDHLRRRLLWDPSERPLKWQLIGSENEPELRTTDKGLRELIWESSKVPRIEVESSTPDWHFDYPWIEYSDYEGWDDFGRWALALYDPEVSLPSGLMEVCDQLKNEAPNERELIIDTLRWVQRNIRYLGSFMGEHTHEPYPLDQVFEKRFGDCKDKGMMTVAMLRHLGFDAHAALVNTSRGHGLEKMLPGHSGFTHLIVHLNWEDDDHWLDPTYTFQRGPLEQLDLRDYGFSYIVEPGGNSLSELKPRGIEVDRTEIIEDFQIGGFDEVTELRVTTTSTGGDANGARYDFANDPLEETEESYLEFYESLYPGIELASPIRFEDDPEANRVVIHEHYRIPNIWEEGDEDDPDLRSVDFYAKFLASRVNSVAKQSRESPYAVSFPNHIRHVITATLTSTWDAEEQVNEVTDPHFDYRSVTGINGNKLRLEYEFKALKKHVAAKDYDTYRENISEVRDDLFYYISQSTAAEETEDASGNSSFAQLLLSCAGIFGLLLGVGLCAFLYFWDPPAREPTTRAHVGLGGWLILPIIGIFLTPIMILIDGASFFGGLDEMGAHLESLDGFDPWRIYYFLGVFFNALFLPVSLLLGFLMFRYRTSFPWVYIGLSASIMLGDFVLAYFENSIPDMEEGGSRAVEAGKQMGRLFVWGWYMVASQRVKATFSGRRLLAQPPSLPPQRLGPQGE